MQSVLKYLIASLFVLGADGDLGWFSVEQERESVKPRVESDSSIWVLFSKDLGTEGFLVRFPEAPAYRYLEDGGFEMAAHQGGDLFVLTVQEKGAGEGDLHYPEEGKWVHEHFVQTAHHHYHFKAITDQPDTAHFQTFISSFSIERNR